MNLSPREKRVPVYNLPTLPNNAEEEGKLARVVPGDYDIDDPYLNWFYQPHTITLLIITVIALIYIAFNVDDSTRNPKL